MKSLWNRLKYSVQADLHEMLDKKESNNPIAMLNQSIREAEKQTESVGKLLDRQAKLKFELDKELQNAQKMVNKRRHQLELAKNVEVEDLIAFAEVELHTYETRANELAASIEETTHELLALERKFEAMKHKVKDMKVRQLQLMGKENAVRANHRMDQVIAPEKAQPNLSTLEEMEQYIQNLGGKTNRDYERSSMENRLQSLEENTEKEPTIV